MTRLSEREQQIAILVSLGKQNNEIAKELKLTTDTVKVYLTKILKKFGLRNRTELAVFMLDQKGPLAALAAVGCIACIVLDAFSS